MKEKTRRLMILVISIAIILILWSFYTVLITLLIPDISLRSKLSIAVAFSIPTVLTWGISGKLRGAKIQ